MGEGRLPIGNALTGPVILHESSFLALVKNSPHLLNPTFKKLFHYCKIRMHLFFLSKDIDHKDYDDSGRYHKVIPI